MKHTKKWLKITASTLALTGAIATPIALTSCSKTNNNPFQPIETTGAIQVAWKEGASEKLTLQPFSSLNLNTDDLFTFKNTETDESYQASQLDFTYHISEIATPLHFTVHHVNYVSSEIIDGVLKSGSGSMNIPGEYALNLSSISLKENSSISCQFVGGDLEVPFEVANLPGDGQILPDNYDNFNWKMSLSLKTNNNYTDSNSQDEINISKSDLYLFDKEINFNDHPSQYTDASVIIPTLVNQAGSLYIRDNTQNIAAGNILNNDNSLTLLYSPKETTVDYRILNNAASFFNFDDSLNKILNSGYIALVSNDQFATNYDSLYQGKKIVFYAYLKDASNLNSDGYSGHLLKKFTVNFN